MQVGQTARRTRRISVRDIELFTEMTGDSNPVHYDADVAARSRFGGIIVQGGVTSGLLNALVAEDLVVEPDVLRQRMRKVMPREYRRVTQVLADAADEGLDPRGDEVWQRIVAPA